MFENQPNNFLMNRDEDQPLRTKDVEKRLHSIPKQLEIGS